MSLSPFSQSVVSFYGRESRAEGVGSDRDRQRKSGRRVAGLEERVMGYWFERERGSWWVAWLGWSVAEKVGGMVVGGEGGLVNIVVRRRGREKRQIRAIRE
ncbi:hypothetical protein HAX54_038400 [Datura stramonium]|uniref:Uncharacterized protein n=1 Tax=Datura stramonium TaxID=4076 RepID=A0ABS8VM18_DATST|nr:hypothetical protein [Datura stramonium]